MSFPHVECIHALPSNEWETELLAILVRKDFDVPGITFLTDGSLSQQLAYIHHPAGKVIEPHYHNAALREIRYTQEVLLVRRGRLRADFYDRTLQLVTTRILHVGDVLLLISGGHGFKVLEECEIFEVKQGPFAGDNDKTRFKGVQG